MKINNYKLFLESTKDIEYICHKYRISNYIIHSDGTVDVNGDVDLYNKKLTQLPVKFGKVTGYFTCSNNHLTSLEGSPYWVGRYFDCSNNQLTSLVGSPKWIGGYFSCEHNQLKTLEGSPNIILSTYYCGHNKLTTLEGSPYWISGYFDCSINQLKSLEGGPKNVLGEYLCNNNQLVNFRGFPEDYETTVWDNENMSGIYMKDNPVNKLLFNLPEYKWNKFIYWCNEYDAIDDQGKVIPERMEEVYSKLGLEYEEN